MFMDADYVILLAQCLSNKYMSVCRFTIGFLDQGRGQRSWSAKTTLFNFCTFTFLKRKQDLAQESFNVYLCK